jgi:hypothetical protein
MSKMKKCGLNLVETSEQKGFAARRYINKMEIKLREVMFDYLYWI